MLINYGAGNILSLKCALEKVGFSVVVASKSFRVEKVDAIALPGVGSFSTAMTEMITMKEKIFDLVKEGIPILGICLGMQVFLSQSEEGEGKGLSFFQGKNVRLPNNVKVPHMGWNTIQVIKHGELFEGVPDRAYVYFVHSLYPVPVDKNIVSAQTFYGTTFTSAVSSKNIFGTQFHPEKSGEIGLNIIRNFLSIVKK